VKPLAFVLLLAACTLPSDTSVPDKARLALQATPADTILAAGDIGSCASSYRDDSTAKLIDAEPTATVLTLGDNVYGIPTLAQYQNCYGPSWGRFKQRTIFTAGNHDYNVTDSGVPRGLPYYQYANDGADSGRAGHKTRGYFAKDLPAGWRLYVLNSEVSTTETSAQAAWLQADLTANPRGCAIATVHRPYFTSSSTHPPQASLKPLIDRLVTGGVDVILSGHNHHYERFAPQTSARIASATGIRQFVVGTGGSTGAYPFVAPPQPNSEVRAQAVFGVLKLTLYPASYHWQFVPISGQTFTDSGTTMCSGGEPPPPPPPPPTSSIALKVTGRTDLALGKDIMTLDWTGALGTNVDVYRNGPLLTVQLNDGHYGNSRSIQPRPTTYTYKVCETASAVCSDPATVSF
jgi:predicted phosphodiesterase